MHNATRGGTRGRGGWRAGSAVVKLPPTAPTPKPLDGVLYNGDGAITFLARDRRITVSPQRIRSSPVFEDMFQAGPSHGDEGSTDHPIPVPDDGEEFYNFMWFIHASPVEISRFDRSPESAEKCAKLLDIASLSHKYQFEEHSDWAADEGLKMAKNYLSKSNIVSKLVTLVSKWGPSSQIFKDAEKMLLDIFRTQKDLDLIALFSVLENAGCRKLLGMAYYRLLVRGGTQWQIEGTQEADARLRPVDCRRLMNGVYRLTMAERATSQPSNNFGASPLRIASRSSWDLNWDLPSDASPIALKPLYLLGASPYHSQLSSNNCQNCGSSVQAVPKTAVIGGSPSQWKNEFEFASDPFSFFDTDCSLMAGAKQRD